MELIEPAVTVGLWSLAGVIGLISLAGLVMGLWMRRQRRNEARVDAQKDARRWYDLLSGQLELLAAGDDAVAARALEDASECFTAAAGQLADAVKVSEFRRVRQTATEGLRYVGVARARLGLVAGPQGPPPVTSDGRPMYEERYRAAKGAWDEYDQNERAAGGASPPPASVSGVTGLVRPR